MVSTWSTSLPSSGWGFVFVSSRSGCFCLLLSQRFPSSVHGGSFWKKEPPHSSTNSSRARKSFLAEEPSCSINSYFLVLPLFSGPMLTLRAVSIQSPVNSCLSTLERDRCTPEHDHE